MKHYLEDEVVLDPADGYEVVTSYREAEEVFRRHREFFAEGGRGEEAVEFLDGTLINLDGRRHADDRRMLAPLLMPSQLDLYGKWVDDAIDNFLNVTTGPVDRGEPWHFDLVELARSIFWTLGARMTGIDDVEGEGERMDRFVELVPAAVGGTGVLFSLKDHGEVIRRSREATEEFRQEFFAASFQRRREALRRHEAGELPASELPMDVLTLTLAEHRDPAAEDMIVRQCLVFLIASVSSTVAVTCHAVAELSEWLDSHPDQADLVRDPTFIERVVRETIRLHRTGSPYLLRIAGTDVTLRTTGRTFTQGSIAAIDMRKVSRDKEIFGADADSFNPDRELSGERVRGYGLGFASGPHTCFSKRMVVDDSLAGDGPRIVDRVVTRLLELGVRPDPNAEPEHEPHGGDRFARFPVVLGRIA